VVAEPSAARGDLRRRAGPGRARTSRTPSAAYITAAYWFTSSTSFANPAITVGRTLSDTFAGIAPSSVPGFVLMQLLGGALATGAVLVLYPHAAQLADDLTHLADDRSGGAR
jgi:arsenate reductase